LARVIVHKAPWVLIDEVLDSLDDKALERAVDILTKDLAQSGVIYIGRNDAHHAFSRVLHLIMDPTAKKLKNLAQAAPAAARAPAPAATSRKP
jgi:putative ATP-binding cassette transporter